MDALSKSRAAAPRTFADLDWSRIGVRSRSSVPSGPDNPNYLGNPAVAKISNELPFPGGFQNLRLVGK